MFDDFSFLEAVTVAAAAGALRVLVPDLLGYKQEDFTGWQLWAMIFFAELVTAWTYWAIRWVYRSGRRKGTRDDKSCEKIQGEKGDMEKADGEKADIEKC